MRLPGIHVVRVSRSCIKFISVVKYKLSNNEKCYTNRYWHLWIVLKLGDFQINDWVSREWKMCEEKLVSEFISMSTRFWISKSLFKRDAFCNFTHRVSLFTRLNRQPILQSVPRDTWRKHIRHIQQTITFIGRLMHSTV